MSDEPLVLPLPDERATAAFGADLARVLRGGDRVALVGDLGAGKTTLARAVLRTLAGDPEMDVPSPTFTLVQDYDTVPPVRHVDLYRLQTDADLAELGLGEDDAVELIEWPREDLPIRVALDFVGDGRVATVAAPPAFRAALARMAALRHFLDRAGWGTAVRAPLAADASVRRFERLAFPDGAPEEALRLTRCERAVLMDAPAYTPDPDSYSAKARRADGNPGAFLAVGAFLAEAGLDAPRVILADAEQGFILMEDFGDEKVAVDGVPVPERYVATAAALARFHAHPVPAVLPGPPPFAPPRFDADLALAELAQFPRWVLGREPDADWNGLWRAAIDALPRDDDRLALRDVHSPNLLWLTHKTGVARVGFIDYQDAMIAPAAFDVVSLGQDARLDVPPALEEAVVAAYLAARPKVDAAAFRSAYAVIGAQRAARIAGAFHRLAAEGRPQYLPHLPRTRARLARNLGATPALGALADWFRRNTDVMEAA